MRFVFPAFLFLLSSVCSAQERLELKGKVVDSVGAVVAGSSVTLTASDGKFVAPKVTGNDGSFQISDLKSGDYVLNVRSSGFVEYQIKLTLSHDETVRVQLKTGASDWNAGDIADLYKHLKAIAGDDSIDCGDVELGENPSKSSHCALDALAKRKPFRVVYHLQGIDSEVAVGLAYRRSGKAFAVDFDSMGMSATDADRYGKFSAGNHIFTYPCPAPVKLRLTKHARVSCFPKKATSPSGDLMSLTDESY
jgi:hypothetical protein